MPAVLHNVGFSHARRPTGLCTLFLIAACSLAILFTNLGVYPLWGSEGRWAVIGKYMFESGDIFTPLLGKSVYWDKPLVSYWQILPFASLLGRVSELAARLPSALWACVMLLLTYDLARRWLGRSSAPAAAAVLFTSCGFVFWGRNAQVEMTNAAMITLILWYFFTRREGRGSAWIFVLAFLMGIGSNMKGLTALGAPVFCILLTSIATHDWQWLPRPRTALAAAAVFAAAFLLIPLASCLASSSCGPLALIWKENVVRFFQPFDHKASFFVYFYRIFDLGAPWSVLLPLSLFTCFGHGRYHEGGVKNALLVSAGIFLFFTLSGSRRSYYLLPILPFTSILLGDFIARFIRNELPPKTGLAVELTGILIGASLMGPLAMFFIRPLLLPQSMSVLFPWAVVLAAGGAVMVLSFLRRYALGMVAPVALVWLVFVFAVIPWASAQPGNIRSETAKLNAMDRPLGFLSSDDAKTVFYLERPYAVLPDIDKARVWAERTGGVIVTDSNLPDLSWQAVIDEGRWKAFIMKKSSDYSESSPPPQPGPAA